MIDDILTSAGFVENKTYIETLFRHPPKQTFCVYFDEIKTDGSDFNVDIEEHSVMIELYALDKPDKAAEIRLENILKSKGIHYNKIPRIFIDSEKYYKTVYEFDFTEKR